MTLVTPEADGRGTEALLASFHGSIRDLRIVIDGLRQQVGVGEKEEVVDAIVFLTVHLGSGGELEHALERDGRLLAFVVAFSDETGPHGVVKFQ